MNVSLLHQGMIIWVTVADPRGASKRRPVVVVTADEEIPVQDRLVGVAVTTSFPDPPPAGHVPLPWDPSSRAMTRLRRRSAAVCNWLVSFRPEEVDSVAGVVPASVLLSIIQGLPARG